MTTLDRQARRMWLLHATDSRYGRCETCNRIHDDDGKLLFVARQGRGKFECQSCHGTRDQGVAR